MQIRLKAGEFTRALGLTTKWFHFLIPSSRSPSNNHATFAMKAPWAGFKPVSLSERISTSLIRTRFINSPPLEVVAKLKRSSTLFLLLTPQSNSKVSYLFGCTTNGNFLALQTKKSQECKWWPIQWKSVGTMPLQTIKTSWFWPQEVLNQQNGV